MPVVAEHAGKHRHAELLIQVLAVQQKEDRLKKQTKDLQAERDQVHHFVWCHPQQAFMCLMIKHTLLWPAKALLWAFKDTAAIVSGVHGSSVCMQPMFACIILSFWTTTQMLVQPHTTLLPRSQPTTSIWDAQILLEEVLSLVHQEQVQLCHMVSTAHVASKKYVSSCKMGVLIS